MKAERFTIYVASRIACFSPLRGEGGGGVWRSQLGREPASVSYRALLISRDCFALLKLIKNYFSIDKKDKVFYKKLFVSAKHFIVISIGGHPNR
jgi:hypothetical protein